MSSMEKRVRPAKEETTLPGVFVFLPKIFPDERGYFSETYRLTDWSVDLGFHEIFVQDNLSLSKGGVLRGLHVQSDMGKLVRCIQGEILDVAVDIRPGSASFGKHTAQILSADNMKALWVPKGFAHGFQALTDTALVMYKCTAIHNPSGEFGVNPMDPALAVPWRDADKLTMSDKDANAPNLADIPDLEEKLKIGN